MSKSIPVPNVTVTKSTPIRYTHTVGNQVISIPPPNSSTTTSVTNATATTTSVASANNGPTVAITQLTDEQKRIVFEFKQKMAQLPPEQQPAFIAQHKGSLLKQLNFQKSQLELFRNNHIQLQLSKPHQQLQAKNAQSLNQKQRPLPVGAGTIRPQGEASNVPESSTGNKQKNIAWIENQIRKDQHEAVNPKYNLPFKSKDDAIKRLLRYHVFYDLDTSPEEMAKGEDDFEDKSLGLLEKYGSMMNRYHYLLTQESRRMVSSSEEVMLARLWDSEERQMFAREKEDIEAGNILGDVALLDKEQRSQYSNFVNLETNSKKRKMSGELVKTAEEPKLKYPKTDDIYQILNSTTTTDSDLKPDNNDDEESDDEFTLKDVDTERAVGSILDAATSNEDDDDEVDDVLQQMGNEEDDDDVVAAAFGNDSVQNAINSILDTLPQGDRIETPDINNITGLFDSIEDEAATDRDPMTEAAVNSIPQF